MGSVKLAGIATCLLLGMAPLGTTRAAATDLDCSSEKLETKLKRSVTRPDVMFLATTTITLAAALRVTLEWTVRVRIWFCAPTISRKQ